MSENNYQILIEKLNKFIKKYYKNQIIKGLLYGTSLMLLFYLGVAIPEYYGEFGTTGRSILFWSFVGSSGYIGIRFIFIPLFKLLSIGQTLSHNQAAIIVGQHFSGVADKLLNTLQLKELAQGQNSPLLEAAIQQRMAELKPIRFTAAIDFGENKKYVKYIVPPLAIIVVILFAAPSILTDSTERLVRFNEEIIKKAPYQITLTNDALEVRENGNFELEVVLKGALIPEKFYLVVKGQKFKMKQEGMGYTHLFRIIQKDTEFQFYGGGFLSETYTLKTLPTPRIVNFTLALDYPGYTGLKDQAINNTGDITAPEGTHANWQFETQNTSEFTVAFNDTVYNLDHQGKDSFQMSKDLFQDGKYSVNVKNEYLQDEEAIHYQINIIPDHHPSIHVEEERDSLLKKDIFFTGEIQDDYGFKQLVFNYLYLDESGKQAGELVREKVDISRNSNQQAFFFRWNLSKLNLPLGQELNYYFEVWDNDGVHGSKSSRTMIKNYNAPTIDELQEERDEDSKDIKKELEETMLDAKKIREDLEELRKELLQKEEMSWQDRKKIEDMLKRQRELQKNVENIQNKNDLKNQKESKFSPKNESLLKKQQQLEQLMDQIMSDEMKEMMDELEKLMEELNMDEIQEQIEDMDLSTEDIEKELDRALEQFKQLEWEQNMEEALDELEQLSKEQEELSVESKKDESKSEEMEKKQEDLEKKFEDWEKKMEEIEKLNEELEEPNAMPENKKESEEVKEDMDDSKEQLKKDKKKKASESQKSAADKMKEMSEKMDMMMKSGSSKKEEEDMEDLRALLENVISLSFDQEALMENLRNIDKKDPKYVSYAQIQRNLKDDAKMVEDSLFALSKRVIQLQGPVNREISLVNENMESALEQLGERQTEVVNKHQQYVMTSFNNLALLLDEALKQMQKESSCDKPGKGNCEKPGGMGKKPSAGDMKKMQDALSKQLKELKEKGENQGNNKGRSPMSKELAKMAAKQAAIRKEIQKMAGKLNEDGSGSGNPLKMIAKEMEQLEKDLVNKKINQETLDRQKDIMIRLLKAENAERQREMDQKRKSTEAFNAPISNPLRYSEYQKRKEQEVEMLKTIPPALKPYYRKKVNDYFNKLGN